MTSKVPFSVDCIKKVLNIKNEYDEIHIEHLSTNGFFSDIYQLQCLSKAKVVCSMIVKLPSGEKFNKIVQASTRDNERLLIDGVPWTEFCSNCWLPFSHENEERAFRALKKLAFSEFPVPKCFFAGTIPEINRRALIMQDLTSLGSPLGSFFDISIATELFKCFAHFHSFCLTTTNWKPEYESSQHADIYAKFWAYMRRIYALDDIEQISPVFADISSYESYFNPLTKQFSNVARATLPDVLVHGDLFPANVLVSGESVTGILDFQFSHIGQPTEDLAKIASFLDCPEQGKALLLNTYFEELKALVGNEIGFTESALCQSYDQQLPFALAATLLVFPENLKSEKSQLDKERLIQRSERIIQHFAADYKKLNI